jgi:putative hydrolase of the HAD superfamily
MIDSTPQFIYFDLGNVLLTFDHQIACRQVAELAEITPERVWEILFASDLQSRYERGEMSSREFYEEFCRVSLSEPDYGALHRANSQMFELNVPVIPIVSHLMSAGHRLGILSNTCEAHWQYVSDGRFTSVRDFFEVQVLSYQERCSKPEVEMYTVAARRAGVAPERIFFVDDNPENVAGALQAGFDAVVFQGPQQLASELRSRGLKFNY